MSRGPNRRARAAVTPGMRPVEPQRRTHPDDQYASIENLDRVQDALRSYDDIKVATDRLVRVVPDGAGARARRFCMATAKVAKCTRCTMMCW